MILSVFYEHIKEAANQSGKTLQEVCKIVKNYGIDIVEMDAKQYHEHGEEIANILREADLSVGAMYDSFDWGHCDETTAHIQAENYIKTAKSANTHHILIIPGFLNESELKVGSAEYESCVSKLETAVAYLCESAKSANIVVGLEDYDSISAPFATAAQVRSFLDAVPELTCTFDTGNFAYTEEDVLNAYALCKDRIKYVHCKDRTYSKNNGEEKLTVNGNSMYPTPVGSGFVPIKEIVTLLLNYGYDDIFAIEHFAAENQLDYMEKSAKFLLDLRKEWSVQ